MQGRLMPPAADLLRRFLARPLTASIEVGGLVLTLETDNEDILSAFLRCGRPVRRRPGIRCAIVRNDAAHPFMEFAAVYRHETTIYLRFGSSAQIAADTVTKEICGHVAASSAGRILETAIPMIVAHLRPATEHE